MVPADSHRASPTPRYSGYCYALKLYAYGTITLYRVTFQLASASFLKSILQSYNPDFAVTKSVWAVPRSLATTWGITLVFSSSAYLDVSVQRVRQCPLREGYPIRKYTDQFLSADPRILSQLVTSFIASETLDIPHTPLVTYLVIINYINIKYKTVFFIDSFPSCQRTWMLPDINPSDILQKINVSNVKPPLPL